MDNLHIHAPQPTRRNIRTGTCPDCKQRTRFLQFWTDWYGWDSTCLRCGREWVSGEWSALAFTRGSRQKNIEAVKKRWRHGWVERFTRLLVRPATAARRKPMNTPTLFGTEPANLAGATLDPERIYRYVLWRHWDLTKPPAILIGLNPSTADEHTNDPTIRKETRLAMSWGMGGLIKLNIFGFRATQPADMKRATDPIGPENDRYLIEYCSPPGLVIACWGSHGAFMERGQQVRAMLEPICQLHYLKLSENTGQPWHPLYLPEKGLVPVVWS